MVNYQIDSGPVVNQAYSGTLESNESSLFTFTTSADLSLAGHTYMIDSWTWHPNDNDISNDHFTKFVTNIYPNDVGVVAITAPPAAGSNLGMETITATLQNFGSFPQSNFDVSYVLDGGTPIVEQVAGTLSSGASVDFSFSTQGDFSSYSDHSLSVTTALSSDTNPINNTQSFIVTNAACTSTSNTTSQTIGPNAGTIVSSIIDIPFNKTILDVNVTIEINHSRDADLDIFLMSPAGMQIALSLSNGGAGQHFTNTTFDDQAMIPISAGTAPFTGSYTPDQALGAFNGLQTQGVWTLFIYDNVNGNGGSLISWDLLLCYDPNIGIQENETTSSSLIIASLEHNRFSVSYTSSEKEQAISLYVYNVLGQEFTNRNMNKTAAEHFICDLDMSYASPGVYLLKLKETTGRTVILRRIIVK